MKLIIASLAAASALSTFADTLETNKIDQITGLKGKFNEEENVYKISSPRTDVKISVDDWQMPPFMGLTSWAAFSKGKKEQFMTMGDLVLFQDEVNSVMSAALDQGLAVTALHNHFFYDNPKLGSKPRKGYLLKGNEASQIRVLKNFVEISFENGKGQFSSGFVLKKDVEKIQ